MSYYSLNKENIYNFKDLDYHDYSKNLEPLKKFTCALKYKWHLVLDIS